MWISSFSCTRRHLIKGVGLSMCAFGTIVSEIAVPAWAFSFCPRVWIFASIMLFWLNIVYGIV